MEFVPTAYDYNETVDQLRASYNRCVNGLDGCSMDQSRRTRCLVACRYLYETYMKETGGVIQNMHNQATTIAADPSLTKEARVASLALLSKQLNRHNRQLGKLTQLFLMDICDNHPTDQKSAASTVSEGKEIQCDIFLTRLENLVRDVNRTGAFSIDIPYYEQ